MMINVTKWNTSFVILSADIGNSSWNPWYHTLPQWPRGRIISWRNLLALHPHHYDPLFWGGCLWGILLCCWRLWVVLALALVFTQQLPHGQFHSTLTSFTFGDLCFLFPRKGVQIKVLVFPTSFPFLFLSKSTYGLKSQTSQAPFLVQPLASCVNFDDFPKLFFSFLSDERIRIETCLHRAVVRVHLD